MYRFIMTVSLALLGASEIRAQAPAAAVGIAATLSPDGAQQPGIRAARAPKSPSSALALSFSVTALSYVVGAVEVSRSDHRSKALVALAIAGILVGPSSGYIFGGSGAWKRGLIIRTLGAGALAGAAASSFSCGFSGGGCDAQNVLGVAGLATIVISDIVDIAHVRRAVRAANARANTVTVMPTWRGGRHAGPGLEARIAFGGSGGR